MWQLDPNGWLKPGPNIWHKPSPNHDERPPHTKVELLVLHNISLPPGEFKTPYIADLFLNKLDIAADPWFANIVGLRVSAHFVIERDGTTTQFVSCDQRAWHAGISSYAGRERCNDFSIGIELEGTDTLAYTEQQYDTLTHLTACLRLHYPLDAVRGHCHIAPDRKTDPGPAFDWTRYARLTNWKAEALPK